MAGLLSCPVCPTHTQVTVGTSGSLSFSQGHLLSSKSVHSEHGTFHSKGSTRTASTTEKLAASPAQHTLEESIKIWSGQEGHREWEHGKDSAGLDFHLTLGKPAVFLLELGPLLSAFTANW